DEVTAIVEHKDANDEQRTISEVNSGVFAFDASILRNALSKLDSNNSRVSCISPMWWKSRAKQATAWVLLLLPMPASWKVSMTACNELRPAVSPTAAW